MKSHCSALLFLATAILAAGPLAPCDQAQLIAATTPVNSGPIAKACLTSASIKDMQALFNAPLTPTQASIFTKSPKCQTWYSAYTGVLANVTPCAMPNGIDVRAMATVPFASFLTELQKAANATTATNATTPSSSSSVVAPAGSSSSDSAPSPPKTTAASRAAANTTSTATSWAVSVATVTATAALYW
ncbi:hypothetical protein SPRG_21384 [Saprolegnia parasitica CBS 223.65]|uniref:Secreted protein n=1 Tax=Saprolegnia parasitica (strain CBS 223.65) TaxID=695850 RepID=A0A067BZL3_SAPPC|nr:hypothetical protein SPRG_21384 [Saprolegnia parasitica CBS 223.65]KDO20022.1 hypothetical protein SPRG_21384 [Saprolegnia parasitica CBS 223.65]|eukprot:XP_012209283.1 hypothetical protein SPRG_21384 [Saprolegnia parasitica CBS 223.65]